MNMEKMLAHLFIALIMLRAFITASLKEWNDDEIIVLGYTTPDPAVTRIHLDAKFRPQAVDISHIKYMANIYVQLTHECSGAYFSPLWVLACALCISAYSEDDYVVYMGSSILHDTNQQSRLVERILTHIQYSEYPERFNIGLIKLTRAFDVGPAVGMIKLAEKEYSGGYCSLVGWGLSILSVQNKSYGMLEDVLVRPVNTDVCQALYKSYDIPAIIDESIICMKSKYNNEFCTADVGTTLVCNGVLVGVTAANVRCLMSLPVLVFNVSFFRQWILDEINKYSSNGDYNFDNSNRKEAHLALFCLFIIVNKALILYK